MSQPHYVQNISFVSPDCTFEDFRKQRALFSWMLYRRPDLSCYANKSSQVSTSAFCKEKHAS